MKRGEIRTAATGHGFGSKPRPVLIIQADEYANAPLLLTVGVTGELGAGLMVRPRVQPTPSNGLRKESDVMVDLILPVRRDQFDKFVGIIDATDMARVEAALLIILGFKT